MIVYLTAFLLSIIFAYFYRVYEKRVQIMAQHEIAVQSIYVKPNKKNYRKGIAFSFQCLATLPLILVAGFREGVGTDFYSAYVYSYYYNEYGNGGYYSTEYIYNMIETALAKMQMQYLWLFLVCALIWGIFFYLAIFRYSTNPEYSILLLLLTSTYFISLNGVRQGMAMAIFCFSIPYIEKKDWKHYFFFIIIAIGIHTSSIIFIPVYFICQIKLNVIFTVLLMVASVIGASFIGQIAKLLISHTPYAGYYKSIFYSGDFEWAHAAIQVSILALYLLYYGHAMKTEYKKQYQVLYWLQVFAVFFILESANIPLAKRMCWSMSVNQLFGIPLLNRIEPSRLVKFLMNFSIIALFALAIYIGVVKNGAHEVLPYKTVFGYL